MEMKEMGTKAVQVLFHVMQTPLFVKLLQNKSFLRVLTEGLSLPVRTRELAQWSGERMARRFGWATAEDLRRLEHELLERYQTVAEQGDGRSSSPLHGADSAGQGVAGEAVGASGKG
jgi:hypothetical protein